MALGIDLALKRYFPGVVLGLVAIGAYFQASGSMQLVGARLAVDEKALAALPKGAPRALAPASTAGDSHATTARALLDRNPFDSVTPRPLDKPALAEGEAAPEVVDLDHYENAPPCDGVKALIVAASPGAPEWSMAVLSGGGAATKMVRVGDDLANKTIRIIEWNRVVLQAGGTLCQVQMWRSAKAAAAAASAAPAPVAPPPPGPGGPSGVPQDIASKIQKVGATEFNIDRQVVDKILENQAELMKSARIVPEQEGGKTVGIRLFGIRPDTLLGVLGLENGDRLQQINGFDMASPEKALEAYARLRTADHLTVQVNRRGKDTNIDFNIK